jgi:AhpD family alkylhydroperoxidase
MKERINYATVAPDVYQTMLGVHRYLERCGLDERLMNLIYLRASQMNGCAYCIDMHWKDLRELGETEQRLYGLDAWEESPYYTQRERAAFAWTQAITNIQDGHAPDAVYQEVRKQFNEKEIADLTFAIATINAWNRLAIAARTPAGSYQPQRTHQVKQSA